MSRITRRAILEKYIEGGRSQSLEQVVATVVSQHQETFHHNMTLPHAVISTLKSEFKKRWKRANAMKDRFYKHYSEWLEQGLKLGVNTEEKEDEEDEGEREGRVNVCGKGGSASCSAGTSRRGRSPVDFENASERTKRRRTQDIRNDYSTKELLYAAEMKLREEGKKDAAIIS